MFLIMLQVAVSNTTTTPHVTAVCSGALLISMTFALPPTPVGQTTLSQHDVVLPPKVILRDTMRGPVGLTTMPQQQQPQSQMPSQAYANFAMGPPQVAFLF